MQDNQGEEQQNLIQRRIHNQDDPQQLPITATPPPPRGAKNNDEVNKDTSNKRANAIYRHRAPEDPTRPPSSRFLITQAKGASAVLLTAATTPAAPANEEVKDTNKKANVVTRGLEDPTRPPPTSRYLVEQARTVSKMDLQHPTNAEPKKPAPLAVAPTVVSNNENEEDGTEQLDNTTNKNGERKENIDDETSSHDEEKNREQAVNNNENEDGINATSKKEKDDDDDLPTMVGGKSGNFTEDGVSSRATTASTDEFSYWKAIGPRENVVDLETMKDSVWYIFPDWRRRLSGFTLLIVLASIIATVGIISDSTATVIGAMIVAPLMTPILGVMLGIVLTDFNNMAVSFAFVCGGAVCAIAIGYVFSLFVDESSIDPENNAQVGTRIHPKLLDLIASLATGAVAAVALVRSDIAGSLPGVSIAISLVPPLNVVGVCLRLRNWEGAIGSFLLFFTNYLCILSVGMMVMFMYRVHRMIRRRKYRLARFGMWILRQTYIIVLIIFLVGVGFCLAVSSALWRNGIEVEKCLSNTEIYPIIGWSGVDDKSADEGEWTVFEVVVRRTTALSNEWLGVVLFAGSPPFPIIGDITPVAEECGANDITLQFIPTYRYTDLLVSSDS